MSFETKHTKIIRGKYQITKNIFVICYLHIVEANETAVRTLIKLKSNAFTGVPVGTSIFFNGEPGLQADQPTFSNYFIKVKQVEDLDGNPLHVCTGLNKLAHQELRSVERRPVGFSIGLSNSHAVFTARDGNNQGLTLQYTAKHAMVSLVLDRVYEFSVQLKEKEYLLPGRIKHIQYDWQSHQHIIGVHFDALNKDQEMILNLLVDPDYVIPISNNASIDSAAGKISLD